MTGNFVTGAAQCAERLSPHIWSRKSALSAAHDPHILLLWYMAITTRRQLGTFQTYTKFRAVILTIRVQYTSALVRTLLKTSKCAKLIALALICPTLCVFVALDLGPRSVFQSGDQSQAWLVERPRVAACAAARPPAADCAPPVREQGRRERAGSWGLVRLLARPHARHITWHEPAGRNVSTGEVKYRDSSMPIQECGAV